MKKIARKNFSGLSHLASKAGLGSSSSNSNSSSSAATAAPPTPSSSSASSTTGLYPQQQSSSGGGLLRRANWADKVREKLPELGENEYEIPWERGVLGVIFLESEKGGVPYVSKATESCISPLVHAGDVLRYVNDVRSKDHSFAEFFKILATMKKPVLLRFERPASSTTSSDGEDSPLEQRSSSAAGLGDRRLHAASSAESSSAKVLRSNSVPQSEASSTSQPITKSQRSAFWRTVSAKEPPPAPVRAPGSNGMLLPLGSSRGNGEPSHGFVDTKQFELSPREPAASDSDQYEYEVKWETGSLGLFFGEDRATSLPVVTRSTPNANSVVQRMVEVNDTLVSANRVQSRDFTFEAFFVRLQQMKKPVLLVFRRKIDSMSPAPGAARARLASVTVDGLTSPGEQSARRLPTPPRGGEHSNGLRTPPESPVYERGSVRRANGSLRSRKTELDIDTSGSPPVAPRSSPTSVPSSSSSSANASEVSSGSRRTAASPLNLAQASAAIVAPRTSPTQAEAASTARVSDPTTGRHAAPPTLDLAGASAAIVAPRPSARAPVAPTSAPEVSPSRQAALASSLNLASASAAIMSTRSEPHRSGSAPLDPKSSWEEASESAHHLEPASPKQTKRSTSVPSPHTSAPATIQRQSSSSSPTPATHFSQPHHAHSKRSRTSSSDATSRLSVPTTALDAALQSPRSPQPPSPVNGSSAVDATSSLQDPSRSQHSRSRGVSDASSPLSSPKLPDAAEATSSAIEDAFEAEDEMNDVISPTAIEGQVRMSEEGLSMWEEDAIATDASEAEALGGSRSSWDEPLDIEGDAFDAEGKALDDEFELLMAKLHESTKAAATGASAVPDEEAVVAGVEIGVVADVAIGVAVAGANQPLAGAPEDVELAFVAAEPVAPDAVVVEIGSSDALPAVVLGETASDVEEVEGARERKSTLESELESTSDAGLADDGSDLLDAIEQDIIADIDENDLMPPPSPKLKSASSSSSSGGGSNGSMTPFRSNRSTVHANLAKYKRRPKNSRAVTKLPRLTEDNALTVPLVAPNAVNTTVQVRGRSKPKPSMHETPDSTTYLVKWRESRSIGLQLKEVRLAKGVFPLVTDVCQEPCCEQLKHVCVGDVILEINGRNTSLMGVKKTVGFLKTCTKTTLLKLRHGPGYVPQRVSAHV